MKIGFLIGSAFLSGSAIMILTSSKASCFTISVNSTTYDVETVSGSFNSLSNVLTKQVWFGNENLATQFATSLPANIIDRFAYKTQAAPVPGVFYFTPPTGSLGIVGFGIVAPDFPVNNWAVAKTVPEPLTILGSGIALGFGFFMERKYSKKRSKSAKPREVAKV